MTVDDHTPALHEEAGDPPDDFDDARVEELVARLTTKRRPVETLALNVTWEMPATDDEIQACIDLRGEGHYAHMGANGECPWCGAGPETHP